MRDMKIVVLDNLGTNKNGNEVQKVQLTDGERSYTAELVSHAFMDVSTDDEEEELRPMAYVINNIKELKPSDFEDVDLEVVMENGLV